MRKLIIVFLITLLTILPLLPAAAYTGYQSPYANYTFLSTMDLTLTQQALVDHILWGIMHHHEDITLPKNTLYEDAVAAMRSVTQDYPELFYLSNIYSISYDRSHPEYAECIIPQYLMTEEEAENATDELIALAWLILDSFDHHDFIQNRLCMVASYRNEDALDATAYGAICKGYANCEGYAKAYALMCRMRGVPCGVITGMATDANGSTSPHAWNIIWLDNSYSLVDVTWDDQESLGVDTWWYYGLSTAQMGADHFPDADQVIPECSGASNWHANRGFLIRTEEELEDALRWVSQEAIVNLRIEDPELYARLDSRDFYNAFLENNLRLNANMPHVMVSNDAQQCFIFLPYPD